MIFQIFAEIEMTQNENRLFVRHFEIIQIFYFMFSLLQCGCDQRIYIHGVEKI